MVLVIFKWKLWVLLIFDWLGRVRFLFFVRDVLGRCFILKGLLASNNNEFLILNKQEMTTGEWELDFLRELFILKILSNKVLSFKEYVVQLS